jgi:hemolysin activation/secretion protein
VCLLPNGDASLAVNSALGFGEQIYGTAIAGAAIDRAFSATSPLLTLGGGFVLPLGDDGLTVNPEYTHSVTRPDAVFGAPASEGEFERFALRANYPLLRSRAQTLNLQAAYEWNEERLTPLGFPTQLYQDRYHALRFQAAYGALLPWGAGMQAIGVYSQGLAGRDGTDAAISGVPLSRLGADPTFSKLNLDWRFQQPLPEAFQLALIARAQTSFGAPLFVAEQFSLDGLDALSAFSAGTFSVDQGATLRAELSRSMSVGLGAFSTNLAPYLFAAGGRGELALPTAVEPKDISAASLGVGLRTDADLLGAVNGGSLAVELARKYSDVEGEKQGYRANVEVSVRF